MQVEPMRGGWYRRIGLVVVLLMSMAACGGEDGAGDSATRAAEPAASPGASVAAVQPLLCAGETVLSQQAADSSQTVTVQELQARILTDPAEKPDGYRTQTVIVDNGLGSFRISTPTSFAAFWRNGTPSQELIALAEERDRAWTDYWSDQISSGDIQTRAIAIDGDRTDELVAVMITFTEAPEVSGDDMATAFAESYGSGGALLGESCGIRANGADGAYVEHTVTTDIVGGDVNRTQLQFLIPDPPNGALWGVTCDVPQDTASEVKDTCRQIASTFQPLPPIES